MSTDLIIDFHDNLLPRATAGRYEVAAQQVLRDSAGDAIDSDEPLPVAIHEFEIRAVQFVLSEASVHARYPAAGSAGDYRRVLPHITLDRSILPWEREPKFSRDVAYRAPWLALMVFAEAELPDDPAALGATVARPVREAVGTPHPGVYGPDIALDQLPPETPDSTCHTIDVPVSVFRALAPTEDELQYLAHVRAVRRRGALSDGEELTEGNFGVLTANRLPTLPGSHAVHLVSLEGHDDRIHGGIEPDATALRLAVLHSWVFVNDPAAGFDAEHILAGLVAPGNTEPENLTLKLACPADAPDDHITERLALGYAPVPHRVMSGELGFAWYRGPCTPVTAPVVPRPQGRFTTADHALIYEPRRGLFDVSYAAAWTLGRTIALADPSYTADLNQARRELSRHAKQLMSMAADPARTRDTATGPNADWLETLAQSWSAVAAALAGPRVRLDAAERAAIRSAPAARPGDVELRAALVESARATALRGTADERTGTMPGWLDQLELLKGVPFGYLVPDARMLPPESLRLFRTDPAWTAALVDGACSLGINTSLDQWLDETLRAATAAHRGGVGAPAGMLIRSTLVSAWPEMEIIAAAQGAPLAELRRDLPAPDVLLVLWDGVPDRVELREPAQGIHFGIDRGDQINVRQLKAGQEIPLGASIEGRWFPAEGTVLDFLRSGTEVPGVLHLLGDGGLIPALNTELADQLDGKPLRIGQFALQMVNAPLLQLLLPTTEGAD
ncbi:hypothetical protein ACWCPQ_06485 [Nocardia sp. NPDC001965]